MLIDLIKIHCTVYSLLLHAKHTHGSTYVLYIISYLCIISSFILENSFLLLTSSYHIISAFIRCLFVIDSLEYVISYGMRKLRD